MDPPSEAAKAKGRPKKAAATPQMLEPVVEAAGDDDDKDGGTRGSKYDSQFFKTKLCMFWQSGRCQRKFCKYAHGEEELNRSPDLRKTAMCRAMLQKGHCKAEDCNFAHSLDELRATEKFYKTTMCCFYRYGACKLGDKCRHAHSKVELRSALEGKGLSYPDDLDDLDSDDELADFDTSFDRAVTLPSDMRNMQSQPLGHPGRGGKSGFMAPEPKGKYLPVGQLMPPGNWTTLPKAKAGLLRVSHAERRPKVTEDILTDSGDDLADYETPFEKAVTLPSSIHFVPPMRPQQGQLSPGLSGGVGPGPVQGPMQGLPQSSSPQGLQGQVVQLFVPQQMPGNANAPGQQMQWVVGQQPQLPQGNWAAASSSGPAMRSSASRSTQETKSHRRKQRVPAPPEEEDGDFLEGYDTSLRRATTLPSNFAQPPMMAQQQPCIQGQSGVTGVQWVVQVPMSGGASGSPQSMGQQGMQGWVVGQQMPGNIGPCLNQQPAPVQQQWVPMQQPPGNFPMQQGGQGAPSRTAVAKSRRSANRMEDVVTDSSDDLEGFDTTFVRASTLPSNFGQMAPGMQPSNSCPAPPMQGWVAVPVPVAGNQQAAPSGPQMGGQGQMVQGWVVQQPMSSGVQCQMQASQGSVGWVMGQQGQLQGNFLVQGSAPSQPLISRPDVQSKAKRRSMQPEEVVTDNSSDDLDDYDTSFQRATTLPPSFGGAATQRPAPAQCGRPGQCGPVSGVGPGQGWMPMQMPIAPGTLQVGGQCGATLMTQNMQQNTFAAPGSWPVQQSNCAGGFQRHQQGTPLPRMVTDDSDDELNSFNTSFQRAVSLPSNIPQQAVLAPVILIPVASGTSQPAPALQPFPG